MPQDTIILKHDSLLVIFHSNYLPVRICWPIRLIFLNPNLVLFSSVLPLLFSHPSQPSSSFTFFFFLHPFAISLIKYHRLSTMKPTSVLVPEE